MFTQANQLILKVTRGCNLRCSYCYVFDKDKFDNEVISDEMFEFVIDKFLSETRKGGVPKNMEEIVYGSGSLEEKKRLTQHVGGLSIVIHGGEPLKIGKERFTKFCKIITQKARQYEKKVDIGVQTNATLIDEEWVDIFHRYNISPGMSWDGLADASENRGKGDIVLEKMNLMKSRGINPGTITIAHKGNKDKLWDAFNTMRKIGISGKINRGVDITTKDSVDSSFELTADELIEMAKDTLFYMIAHPSFREDVLYKKLLDWHEKEAPGQANSRGQICYTRYCGAGNNIVEVEPDGSVLFCGRNSTHHKTFTKSVFDKDVLSLKHIKHNWDFQKNKVKSVNDRKCNLCPAQSFCDYGCMSFSFQKFDGDVKIDDVTCEYNKKLATMFSKYHAEILELIKRDKKNEPLIDYFM